MGEDDGGGKGVSGDVAGEGLAQLYDFGYDFEAAVVGLDGWHAEAVLVLL